MVNYMPDTFKEILTMPDTTLKLHVIPRGSKNEITGWRDDILCIKITAPPVEGAANAAIVKFMADALKIRKSQIELISGEKSREKVIRITGLSEADIHSRLK
ncbi:DUF167 domain-containing protein [bacterium]|nr:DUF167 domain-containing protein [bacterium]